MIILTHPIHGTKILVSHEDVTCYVPSYKGDVTLVFFKGDDKFIEVKETVDEIIDKYGINS